MKKEIPTYRIFIDEEQGALVYKNSIVTNPAHGKKQYAFSEVKRISFEDVKQNIVGVAISPDTPIYRNDAEMGEHYVVFKKEDIEQMAYVFAKNNHHNELEYEHDEKQPTKSASLYFSYIIDKAKGFNPPTAFKDELDGTWLLGYHFTDKNEYEFAKKKGGFSIEGTFLLEKMSNQFKQINMNKNEKKVSAWKKFSESIAELLQPEVEAEVEAKFEDVTLEDGTKAKHEGVGTPLVLVTEDGEVNAEDGSYTLDNGTVVVVAEGLISEITEAEAEAEMNEEIAEFAEAVTNSIKSLLEQNKKFAARIEALEKKPMEEPKKKFARVENADLKPKTKFLLQTLKQN